jgi:hypothetical protein
LVMSVYPSNVVIARSEATRQSSTSALDCFARRLAMTA